MPRVLIVDDEPAILRSTALMLAEMGYEVSTCEAADAILSTIETSAPDVLLQDVRMPGLDLERVVADLRKSPRWAKLPIVLFTASMEAEQIGERVGAYLILDKPFKPAQLVAAIEGALKAHA